MFPSDQRVRAGLRARDLQDFALGSALGRRDCRRKQFEVAGAEACSYPAWQMDGFSLHANTFVGPAARGESMELTASPNRHPRDGGGPGYNTLCFMDISSRPREALRCQLSDWTSFTVMPGREQRGHGNSRAGLADHSIPWGFCPQRQASPAGGPGWSAGPSSAG